MSEKRNNNRKSNDRNKPSFDKKKKQYPRKQQIRKKGADTTVPKVDDGTTRLNKFIANAGISSRREADVLISSGVVEVNGKIITEMGYKVKDTDTVKYGGETIRGEEKVYILMNKPKDFITTVDDPFGRRTVLQLLGKLKQRVYPVGRLDRATTGLLMFTNDGDLTKRLTHPRYEKKKIYHVTTNKNVSTSDIQMLLDGFELEDGFTKTDEASYVGNGSDRKQVGVELHSGKNRIVRRMFDHLGYNVVKLDRVYFSGLTKKDLARGQWRYLTDEEVTMLKMGKR